MSALETFPDCSDSTNLIYLYTLQACRSYWFLIFDSLFDLFCQYLFIKATAAKTMITYIYPQITHRYLFIHRQQYRMLAG